MIHAISRRHFLQSAAVASAAAMTAHLGFAQERESKQPLYKISLAQWSLNEQFFGNELDPLDFAKVARETFDVGAIEYVNQFFPDKAKDQAYLKDLKTRAEDQNIKSLLIMVDREGNLGDPDKAQRTKAVENHYKWVEAAKFLGCHSIRVNAASSGTWEEQRDLAADGLSRLTQFAKQHGLNVLVENHGGLSSNGAWLAAVMRQVNDLYCGTLPDFGNFTVDHKTGDEFDRYRGVDLLMPFAKAVSAKSYAFDESGNETTIDYPRMMGIVLDHNYHGYVGIEFEGKSDPYKGIAQTKALLERIRDERSA